MLYPIDPPITFKKRVSLIKKYSPVVKECMLESEVDGYSAKLEIAGECALALRDDEACARIYRRMRELSVNKRGDFKFTYEASILGRLAYRARDPATSKKVFWDRLNIQDYSTALRIAIEWDYSSRDAIQFFEERHAKEFAIILAANVNAESKFRELLHKVDTCIRGLRSLIFTAAHLLCIG